jgi:hypothetical protein
MKRIIQAAVVASLFAAQVALAFPSNGDDAFPQFQSSYSDGYAAKGAPAMAFPASGDEVMPVTSSTYADRHAGEIARAPMEFPASGDDVIWVGTTTRVDRFAASASDPALSQ